MATVREMAEKRKVWSPGTGARWEVVRIGAEPGGGNWQIAPLKSQPEGTAWEEPQRRTLIGRLP